MAEELWLPESYRSSKALVPVDVPANRSPGQVRSVLFPQRGTEMAGLLQRPGPLGSPHVTRAELIGLFRRHSWVRAALRRIAMIAISEGYDLLPTEGVENPSDEEYEFLRRFFEPEMTQVRNLRQWQLPRQKWYVTFLRLRLLSEVYWEIVEDGLGDPADWAVMFGTVVPLVDSYGDFLEPETAGYVQMIGSKRIPFPERSVLRFEIPDVDGRLGVSDLEAADLPVTTDLYAQVWNRNTFKNNRTVPGAWLFDANTDDETMRQNREALDGAYTSAENANRSYVGLKGALEYKVFGSPYQRDQEYLRGRKFNRDEVLGILGMSPGLLGMVEDVNRANLVGLIEIAYRQEVQPLQDLVEETITLWTRSIGVHDWTFKFRRPSFGNEADEARTAAMLIETGQSTANEQRQKRGEAPYPGGNRFYMKTSVQEVGRDPADEVGQEDASRIGGQQQPTEEGQQEGEEGQEGPEAKAEQLKELKRWKRVAMRMAKEGRWREFESTVLPVAAMDRIKTDLQLQQTPAQVAAFFDDVIADLENYGPGRDSRWFHDRLKADLGQATPEELARLAMSKKAEDGLDSWPDYARERLSERLRSDLDYAAASSEARVERLLEAEIPGLD